MRQARVGEVPLVVAILDDASGWLRERGIRQWPPRWPADFVRPAIAAGETWLADVDGAPVGTVTLQWTDALWSDVDDQGAAGYVHRLAVRRTAAGTGRALLDWAAATARERGLALLRLDCVAHNTGLRAYYERLGFRPRGEVATGGPPGDRNDDGPRVRLARYELALGPG